MLSSSSGGRWAAEPQCPARVNHADRLARDEATAGALRRSGGETRWGRELFKTTGIVETKVGRLVRLYPFLPGAKPPEASAAAVGPRAGTQLEQGGRVRGAAGLGVGRCRTGEPPSVRSAFCRWCIRPLAWES